MEDVYTDYEPAYGQTLGNAYNEVFDIPTHDTLGVLEGGSSSKRDADGGSAIASGGYGCVFRPALRCEGEAKPRANSIAKLMRLKYANAEMKEVKDAESVIKAIPGYKKYFALADYHMCIPAPLTDDDKVAYDNECKSPTGTSADTVNKRLNRLRIIVSPDLGTDLSKAIKRVFVQPAKTQTPRERIHLLNNLINLNKSAGDLLKNGIAKLAHLEFYHADIKPQNIVTNYSDDINAESFTQMKLIDFGLALPHKGRENDVNTFVMFNAPPSAFMFDRGFIGEINRILERASKKVGDDEYWRYVSSKLRDTIRKHVFSATARTHIPYLVQTGARAYGLPDSTFRKSLTSFWMKYCDLVVSNFVAFNFKRDPYFNASLYWEKVYRYNLDVWGFLTTFLVILAESRSTDPDVADQYEKITERFLFNVDYATKPFPVNDIVMTINEISASFEKDIALLKPKYVPTPAPRKTAKKYKLVVVDKLPSKKQASTDRRDIVRSIISLGAGRKRCPQGYIRHKKDKTKCVKRGKKGNASTVKKVGITLRGKRCPKGHVRHKTMKERCVVKKV